MKNISILIAGESSLVTELCLIIKDQADLSVVGEVGDEKRLPENVVKLSADVAIIDTTMAGLNGAEAIRQMARDCPDTKVMVLSRRTGRDSVTQMLRAGAMGYLHKKRVNDEIITGIRQVMQGKVYLCKTISSVIPSDFLKDDAKESWVPDDATPILRTKLHRPQISPDLVPRVDMVARLEELRHRPVTLVSSAAGYGKTTMASLWLEAWDGPSAWVSLDENENDPGVFLSYLLAAIQNAFPGTCTKTQSLLSAQVLPAISVVARYLLNDLDKIQEPFILVLDDYHLIRDKKVHELMGAFLTYPPRQLHLMILTRRDPVLLTSALRGKGQINEIGISELQFTVAETGVFLKNMGLSVEEKTAARIQNKLEGWPAGMRLMSQSIKYSGDIDRLLAGLEGGFAAVVDYLATEALAQLSTKMVDLLVATAILDRFCEPLCTALMEPAAPSDPGPTAGTTLLAKLRKNNLFVISLDMENRWFRYHHLFQELLQRRLKQRFNSKEICLFHLRAGRWFAKNDLIDEALSHAIAANDIPYAVELTEQHRYDLIETDQWHRLNHWIQQLPPDIVATRPLLLLAKGLYYDFCGNLQKINEILPSIESLLSSLPTDSEAYAQAQGEYFTLVAELQFFSGQPELAIVSSQKALELLSSKARAWKHYAVIWNSLSLQMTGDSAGAIQIVHDILNQPSTFQRFCAWVPYLCVCLVHKMDGDLRAAEQNAFKAFLLSENQRHKQSMVNALHLLGGIHYRQDNFNKATAYLDIVLEYRYVVRVVFFCISAYTRALIYLEQGQAEEADRLVDSVITQGIESDNPVTIDLGHCFQIELALRQGRTTEIKRLMSGVNFNLFPPFYFDYYPQLTLIKALIALDTPENDQEAEKQLNEWKKFGESTHNVSFLVQVLALQAVFLCKQGKKAAALKQLNQALTLGEPGGFIRTFVDLGPPMADLLKRLQAEKTCLDYINKLLAVFRDEKQVPGEDGADVMAPAAVTLFPSPPNNLLLDPLVDPLSNRELAVIELLTQRLSNKEIADKLFVSAQTVKSHLKNIYQKMNVHNRRQAVVKAFSLGIIRH